MERAICRLLTKKKASQKSGPRKLRGPFTPFTMTRLFRLSRLALPSRVFLAPISTAPRGVIMPIAALSRQLAPYSTSSTDSSNSSLLELKNTVKSRDFIKAWSSYSCVASNRDLLKQLSLTDVGKLLSLLLRQPDHVNKIIADLKDVGFEMGTNDFNQIAARESPTWIYGEAVVYLDLMRKHGATPDLKTFTTLITSLARTDPVGARNIMDNEEPVDEVPPDGIIYVELARGFLKQKDVDVGWREGGTCNCASPIRVDSNGSLRTHRPPNPSSTKWSPAKSNRTVHLWSSW